MRKEIWLAVLLALGAAGRAVAQGTAAAQPLSAMPYSPTLDLASVDRRIDPCVDFYEFSCGGWKAKNPIPADQAGWDVYAKLANDNQQFLWGILREDAAATDRTPVQQKVGDYFAACMDETRIDALGGKPVAPYLAKIDELKTRAEVLAAIGDLHHRQPGSYFFGSGTGQDAVDASLMIVELRPGGLGLPDRDYYLKTDAKSVTLREQYMAYIQRLLVLSGESADAAKTDADAVLRIETALAKASLTRVERRDPHKTYHFMTVAELAQLTPAIAWTKYLAGQGAGGAEKLNVSQPEFMKAVQAELTSEPVEALRGYLRFHLLTASAQYLAKPYEQANFDFFSKTLRGVAVMPARWKTCTRAVDRNLGEALGQEFVRRTFSADTKARTQTMTEQIEAAMGQEIQGLDWMSPETKQEALRKLHAIRNKIGYPEHWRDYAALTVKRDDYFGDAVRSELFENERRWRKLGKPVDLLEWGMTPPTVNAYFNPQMNDINFPAGVLQPPLYDPKSDDAPNYGNTGATIGHELTHGFDDEGRQFDSKGNLRDWWTAADAKGFETRIALRARSVCGVCGRGRYSHQQQADQRRGRGGPGRNAAGVHGVEEADGGTDADDGGGLYAGSAVLCGHGAVGVRERAAGESAAAGGDRSALARVCADQRRGVKPARVSAGVQLQGGAADGACSGVQGLVRESEMAREINWNDVEELGIQLQEKHPEIEPYTVRFTDLHRYVMELDGFVGEAGKSTESLLEAIQEAWHEEWEDAKG